MAGFYITLENLKKNDGKIVLKSFFFSCYHELTKTKHENVSI